MSTRPEVPEWLARANERAEAHLATLSYDQLGPAGRLLVSGSDTNIILLDDYRKEKR